MYPGERYTVMVKLDQEPGNYTVRVTDNGIGQIESAYAIFQYLGGHKPLPAGGFINYNKTEGFTNYGGQLINPNSSMINGGYDHTPPFPDIAPAEAADAMYVFTLSRWNSAYTWTFTGAGVLPVDADAYTPLLYYPNSTDANDPNLVIRTKNGTWIDIILQVGSIPREPFEISHVLHKHGSKAWAIGNGSGIWNYSSVAEAYAKEPLSFNFENPNYADTFLTAFATTAWYAIRYQVINPGPWLLHCHVETHLAGGMGVVIMDGVDKWPTIPPEYAVDRHGFTSNAGD
jgi:FtsP/CotA-like multicopper oxidase with cupredoxin domain